MSESQEAFKVAKAPGAIEAAQQFMDLSQEYLELVPRLPAQAVPFGRSLRSRTTKRVAALAVVMQRKFVERGENTYMPGLLDRVLAEHRERLSPELRKKISGFQHELAKALKELHEARAIYGHDHESTKSTAELVPQILYGRLVHSDYDKWSEGDSDPWFAASLSFLSAQDKFRKYIWMVRYCLIELSEREILAGLRYENDVHEDSLSPDGEVLDGVRDGQAREWVNPA